MSEPQMDASPAPADDDRLAADRVPPYTHDPERLPALPALVDAVCDGATDPHDAALRVDELSPRIDPLTSRSEKMALFHTFMYLLEVSTPDQARVDARLEPLDGPSLLPVALRDATEAMRMLWLGLTEHVRHPMARARCWDIVFTLTLMRDRRVSAEQAIDAYLEAPKPPVSRRHRGDGLVRAWVLARLVGLKDTRTSNAIHEAMKTLAAEGVDQGKSVPRHDSPRGLDQPSADAVGTSRPRGGYLAGPGTPCVLAGPHHQRLRNPHPTPRRRRQRAGRAG